MDDDETESESEEMAVKVEHIQASVEPCQPVEPVVFPSLSSTPHLDAELEEKVMAIVLAHAPKLVIAERRCDVWDAIAVASNKRYMNGRSARMHTMWLCKLVLNAQHREHFKLTKTLREAVTEFMKFEPFPTIAGKSLVGKTASAKKTMKKRASKLPTKPQAIVRAKITRERNPRSSELPPVKEESPSVALREQVDRLVDELQRERREHREDLREVRTDLRTMMDILQDERKSRKEERELHQQETMAMLEAIRKYQKRK